MGCINGGGGRLVKSAAAAQVQNDSASAPAATAFANANFPLTMPSPPNWLSIGAGCYFVDSEKAVTVVQQKIGLASRLSTQLPDFSRGLTTCAQIQRNTSKPPIAVGHSTCVERRLMIRTKREQNRQCAQLLVEDRRAPTWFG